MGSLRRGFRFSLDADTTDSRIPFPAMHNTFSIPAGFQFAGLHCGLKQNATRQDLALILSERAAVAVGAYTQNRVFAAPVALDRARTPTEGARVVVINSGNANACTGKRGMRDAEQMARLAAEAVGVAEDAALVLSTGIIGEFLPMEKIAQGIPRVAAVLDSDEASVTSAARGMMTTDTVEKIASRKFQASGHEACVLGLAKGAAMIGPNMATMLALVTTDAAVETEFAQEALREAVQETFNCISVDGHMSTNDTVLLLANGASGVELTTEELRSQFRRALREVCADLARAIVEDAEGASHLITLDITGCASRDEAHRVARAIAESPLVKTAVCGADPNWGRIVSAAGYAGVPFDPNEVVLTLNGETLYEHGTPTDFDAAAVSQSIRDRRETHIELRLSRGNVSLRFWTADLTAEYVRLNADYHT